eukprot:2057901-Lingulodinium_polyedra.AAC.1
METESRGSVPAVRNCLQAGSSSFEQHLASVQQGLATACRSATSRHLFSSLGAAMGGFSAA